MIIKTKLTPEQVKVYEEMSGFETTGEVEQYMTDDKTFDLYRQLIFPAPPKCKCGDYHFSYDPNYKAC